MKRNKMRRCAGGENVDTAWGGGSRDEGSSEGGSKEDGRKKEEGCVGSSTRCRCVGSRSGNTVCQAER